ncbi:ABC transporter permease subunit [Microbacterium dextranolyticum]|uniref:ABC transporter permease n=1 Tax=Microbacterium dextranolyticum TaxID=36806 RepID=A0A9W6HNF5_9MICO|nr:ABC transporter permease subunit [Microbacterium dextranolyticum]MBM7462838.1 ABC-2 type transport system permease protein [Microbacterium dextranolyticum]GLJ96057.1 ABC transporter permease [Microbacterium dextranolyticum]
MSAATSPAPPLASRTARAASPYRLSFARVVRSEWQKLLSLRSTWWSLAITVALSVGISLLMASASRDFSVGFAPVMTIVMPMQFTMLVAGILGAISITGEYSTGMIRSTFAAEPRRGTVLVAKAVVLTALIALTTALTYAIAVGATAPILATPIDWSTPSESLVPLLAGVFAMTTFALLGLGFGFLIRNGAGAIAATVGVLFVLPVVLGMFSFAGDSWRWLVDASNYLPMTGAQNATTVAGEHIGRGFATLAAWPAVLLLGSWAVVRRRDA